MKCREMRTESVMKAKRVGGVLAALLLCICMIMPVNTDAAAQVRVRTVKGVTSSYTGRMSYCYVNGQKRKLTKYPIFKKSGAYMGPVGAILKNSKLKVKATAKGDKLTLTLKYGKNKERVITGLKRISKSGLRVYAKVDEIPRVLNGLGIAIISTSEGLMTGKEAKKRGLGGEVLAYIW